MEYGFTFTFTRYAIYRPKAYAFTVAGIPAGLVHLSVTAVIGMVTFDFLTFK